MKTFDELEKEVGRLSVRSTARGASGTGLLSLERERTLLTLSTRKFYHPKTDLNGWFDLRLKQGSRAIWLHNALLRDQRDIGRQSGDQETDIFPNVVVFNAGALGRDHTVAKVIFRIEKLEYFFRHQVIEWQSLHSASKDFKRTLKSVRKRKTPYPREYDFFKPDTLYLIHEPPRILSFNVDGKRYEIGWGLQSSHGWDSIQVKAEPFATITFPKPVALDSATDEIWAWKRMFSQIATEHLDVTSISASGNRRRRSRKADLYLPNTPRIGATEKADPWGFHPSNAPLGRWSERTSLAKAMQAWLGKDDARRTFRVSVDRVLANKTERSSLEDIVTLCSAVESLEELKSSSAVSDAEISAISSGAIKAAEAAKVTIDKNRIRAVLGQLKTQGLPQRLKTLLEALAPHISPEQAKMIVKSATSLRTIAAHGRSMTDFAIPRVGPTVDALSGACVLYDLLTSSFPLKANEHARLRAIAQIEEALNWLSHLESNSDPKT